MPNKILVVDDEIAVCKQLRKFLEHSGYRVVAAYKQESPDIVLLDIRMPGKDGLQTLKELKTLDPEASVIMVTAVNEEDLALQAMAEGAFDYITKPINPEYLELVLKTKIGLLGNDE